MNNQLRGIKPLQWETLWRTSNSGYGRFSTNCPAKRPMTNPVRSNVWRQVTYDTTAAELGSYDPRKVQVVRSTFREAEQERVAARRRCKTALGVPQADRTEHASARSDRGDHQSGRRSVVTPSMTPKTPDGRQEFHFISRKYNRPRTAYQRIPKSTYEMLYIPNGTFDRYKKSG